jgi:hypothetical protein
MKPIVRFFGLAAFAGLLLFSEGCLALHGGGRRLSNADLTLVSFGSGQGELVPCG